MKLKTCGKGTITRKGYVRHIRNRTVRVPRGCIKAQSQSGEKRTDIDRAIMTKKRQMHRYVRRTTKVPRCGPKQVIREGYIRRKYSRRNGVVVNAVKVLPSCIAATGLSRKRGRKGKQLFVLQKGELTKFGYHADLSNNKRHLALHYAVQHLRPLSVFRKLNALYVLNKNREPKDAAIYKADANWVKKTPEYMKKDM